MARFQIFSSALLLLVLFALATASEDLEEAARLFVHKSSPTKTVVEKQPISIIYHVINSGDDVARQINIADRYDPNSFELLSNVQEDGSVFFSHDELQPGGQVSFNVTIEPKLFGIYESTRAKVRYNTGLHIDDVEDDVRSGFSTSLGRVRIISTAEHLRNTSYWVKEWVIFAVLCAGAVLIPFKQWRDSRQENLKMTIKRKAV